MKAGPGGLEVRRVRRRRTPEAAEAEIVAAAEAFLWERPLRELTIDEVMRRTGLSRPSFYVYFKDRHQLALKLLEHLGEQLHEMSDRWFMGEGEGPALVREALAGVAAVYDRHGPVLKALADASTDDPDVEAAYHGLAHDFTDAAARHIDEEIARGRIRPIDARETAEALVWMNERMFTLHLGVRPMTADPRVIVETLGTIWARVLYEN